MMNQFRNWLNELELFTIVDFVHIRHLVRSIIVSMVRQATN